jgi:iron complex transport system ATP-binding protein
MLAAHNVHFAIEGRPLVRGVTLEMHPGEVLALVGPNGAGKSTFLRLLSGELQPTAGSVELEGSDLRSWPLMERARRRSVMPQSSNVAFSFNVLEVVLMGRSPHCGGGAGERDHEIARAAMELMNVDEFSGRSMDTLSGGEQQRVQLARVLAQIWEDNDGGTRYLLLDEPIASMDVAFQHETLCAARNFSERGAGVLVILHDINMAAMYADRIAVLDQGCLRACGTASAIVTESMMKDVFRIDTCVHRHPHSNCPVVIPSPRGTGAGAN